MKSSDLDTEKYFTWLDHVCCPTNVYSMLEYYMYDVYFEIFVMTSWRLDVNTNYPVQY